MSRLVSSNQNGLNMQHAVRNHATMRVADRMDLSGTVTADKKVNLDGFHSPIRKLRVIARTWLALVTVSLGLYLGLPVCGLAQNNQGQNGQGAKPGAPHGTYAFQDSGYVPAVPPATGLVPLQAAGQETFSDNGTITGLVSFSYGGTIFRLVRLKGTFTVNKDGSVSTTLTQLDPPGLTLDFDAWLTPDGNTMTFVNTDTGTIVSGFSTR